MKFGKIDFIIAAVCILSLTAAITDLARGRIYNWLTLPAVILGLAYGFYSGGWTGLGQSALGAGLGLLLYGWIFRVGMMGGGDVKLLMALGAWGGPRFSEEVAILGVLLGGVAGAIILIAKGKFQRFIRKIFQFLASVFVKELEVEFPKVDRDLHMPFGIPIAIAAIWSVFKHPLQAWGMLP